VIHMRVKVIVGAGLLLGLAAIAITLSRSPIAVAGLNTTQEARTSRAKTESGTSPPRLPGDLLAHDCF
jgi:hypothetical protein